MSEVEEYDLLADLADLRKENALLRKENADLKLQMQFIAQGGDPTMRHQSQPREPYSQPDGFINDYD